MAPTGAPRAARRTFWVEGIHKDPMISNFKEYDPLDDQPSGWNSRAGVEIRHQYYNDEQGKDGSPFNEANVVEGATNGMDWATFNRNYKSLAKKFNDSVERNDTSRTSQPSEFFRGAGSTAGGGAGGGSAGGSTAGARAGRGATDARAGGGGGGSGSTAGARAGGGASGGSGTANARAGGEDINFIEDVAVVDVGNEETVVFPFIQVQYEKYDANDGRTRKMIHILILPVSGWLQSQEDGKSPFGNLTDDGNKFVYSFSGSEVVFNAANAKEILENLVHAVGPNAGHRIYPDGCNAITGLQKTLSEFSIDDELPSFDLEIPLLYPCNKIVAIEGLGVMGNNILLDTNERPKQLFYKRLKSGDPAASVLHVELQCTHESDTTISRYNMSQMITSPKGAGNGKGSTPQSSRPPRGSAISSLAGERTGEVTTERTSNKSSDRNERTSNKSSGRNSNKSTVDPPEVSESISLEREDLRTLVQSLLKVHLDPLSTRVEVLEVKVDDLEDYRKDFQNSLTNVKKMVFFSRIKASSLENNVKELRTLTDMANVCNSCQFANLLGAVSDLKEGFEAQEQTKAEIIVLMEKIKKTDVFTKLDDFQIMSNDALSQVESIKEDVAEIQELVDSNETAMVSLVKSASDEIKKLKLDLSHKSEVKESSVSGEIQGMIDVISQTENQLSAQLAKDNVEFDKLKSHCSLISDPIMIVEDE